MSMVFLELYSTLTFPLVPLSYFLSASTYYNSPYIFPHFLLLLTTNNSLSLTLLSFTFLHILLLVYYDATGLSLFSTLHLLAYIFFLSLIVIPLLSAIPLLAISLLLSFSSLLLLVICKSTYPEITSPQ